MSSNLPVSRKRSQGTGLFPTERHRIFGLRLLPAPWARGDERPACLLATSAGKPEESAGVRQQWKGRVRAQREESFDAQGDQERQAEEG
jgi:hypothetical protein